MAQATNYRTKRATEASTDREFARLENGMRDPMSAGREAWMLLLQLFRAQRGNFMTAVGDLKLTPVQAQLLLHLEPKHPVPMNELANALYCDASNITGLVDKLESRNLIERRAGSGDRRVKIIAVTKAGENLRTKLLERISEPPVWIASLAEKEKKALRNVLRKATNLQTMARQNSKRP